MAHSIFLKNSDMHQVVIGGPLLLVLAFCFCFFLYNPGAAGQPQSNATETDDHKKAASTSSSLQRLSPLPKVTTDLRVIAPAQPANSSSGTTDAASNSGGVVTTSPQSTSSGSNGTGQSTPSLQGAVQNHSSSGPSGVTSLLRGTTGILDNLLR